MRVDSARNPHPVRIAVIGAGYVGLTSSACFSHLGHPVVCSDVDEAKVDLLSGGRVHIHEPGLAEMVREGLDIGRLAFEARSAAAAAEADFVFLCVPTPPRADGQADLSCVSEAAAEIAPVMQPGAVVVTKSTVPPGTGRMLKQTLGRAARAGRGGRASVGIAVAHNPEFLREGRAVQDFLHPDRIVIGADDRSTADRVAALYAGVSAPVLTTDTVTAETAKYIANAFLATKLSFVNAAAAACEAVGADALQVLNSLGHDRRVSADFLRPGPGWGGSCLPKDCRALIAAVEAAGYDFSLMRSVIAANEDQFDRIVGKTADRVALEGARVALMGLAFKAGTDDIRSSPALEIARRLADAGASVNAYDPAAVGDAVPGIDRLTVHPHAYAACEGASVLIVATEWDEFRRLDISRVAELMAEHHVIDARNLLDRDAWTEHGFSYAGIGVMATP